LLAAMACSFACVFTVAPIRHFFGLVPAPLFGWATAAVASVLAIVAVELGWHLATGRHMPARARIWLGMSEKVDGPGRHAAS
jgi:hypothetical protein